MFLTFINHQRAIVNRSCCCWCLFKSLLLLFIGRLVVGVGIGVASMTVPIYIAETSPSHVRGQLITLYQLNITAGQFIASIMNGAFSYLPKDGWR